MKYKIGDYIVDRIRFQFLQKSFKELGKLENLLDLGCGNKPYKNIYEAYFSKTIGIDVENSLHTNPAIDMIYDGVTIPFENSEFNCVLCTEVLEHVENPIQFLQEINRVLEKNAYLIITVPFLQVLHEVPYDFNRFTPFALKKMANEAGFEIQRIEGFGSSFGFMITLFIRKPLKFWNKLSKILKFKALYSIYNPFIFLFAIVPQYIYCQFSKNKINDEVYSSFTCKAYGLILKKK